MMKKAIKFCAAVLVVSLCLTVGFEFYLGWRVRNDTDTIIGQVMYVKYYDGVDFDAPINPENISYHVYVKPINQSDGNWTVFCVNSSTKMDSCFSDGIDNITELAIGNTVEIEYKTYNLTLQSYGSGYYAKYIKSVDASSVTGQDIPLVLDEDSYSHLPVKTTESKIIHIAEILDPAKGYIIYTLRSSTDAILSCYWIGESTIETLDEDVQDMLKNRTLDCDVKITYLPTTYPFENSSAITAIDIELLK